MSREIKFRAWDESRKRMFTHSKWVEFKLSDKGELKAVNYKAFTSMKEQELEIMQFTGIKDLEGTDIYEGDIIYIAGYGDYEVEFPFLELYESLPEGDIGKIKGNIYENKEIIK